MCKLNKDVYVDENLDLVNDLYLQNLTLCSIFLINGFLDP